MSNNLSAIYAQITSIVDSIDAITQGIKGHSSKTPKMGRKSEEKILDNLIRAKIQMDFAAGYFERKK